MLEALNPGATFDVDLDGVLLRFRHPSLRTWTELNALLDRVEREPGPRSAGAESPLKILRDVAPRLLEILRAHLAAWENVPSAPDGRQLVCPADLDEVLGVGDLLRATVRLLMERSLEPDEKKGFESPPPFDGAGSAGPAPAPAAPTAGA